MKVFLAITKSNFGGAQRYVYDLALASRDAGHDVTVICGREGELVRRLREEKIRITSLPTLKRDIDVLTDYKNFFFLYHLLKDEKPDVFHANSSKMGGIGCLAARFTKVKKIIFTAHGFAFNEDRPEFAQVFIQLITWFIILLSDTTICVSNRMKDDFKFWPLIEDKMVVIHNGVEHFSLRPHEDARQELAPDATSSTILIGSLSELHHTKALDVAFKALSQEFKGDDVKLVLIGEGEKQKSLEDLSEKLDIEHQIIFKGFMADARELLSGFDIFILPSRTEGLPYALLEAGMAKLPVVASRVGGIPEVITDDVNGLLIPPANPYFLGKALKLLVRDSEKRTHFGEALYETVTTKFNRDEMLRETLALYP